MMDQRQSLPLSLHALSVSATAAVAATSGVLAVSAYAWQKRRRRRQQKPSGSSCVSSTSTKDSSSPPIQSTSTKPTVISHRFDPQRNQPYGNKSISPFGIKLETFLRFCDIGYSTPPFAVSSILSNPKRKLPTLEVDGRYIADSAFIIRYLCLDSPNYANTCHSRLCDDNLTQQQHAIGTAVQSLCEDRLYWIIGYWRYLWKQGFDAYREINTTTDFVPYPIRWLVDWLAWRGISNQLWSQGIGRYTQREIEVMGCEVMDAIETFLSHSSDENNQYLFGDMPSTYDATIFAFLSSIVEIDIEPPLKLYTMKKKYCMRYLDTINGKYWADEQT